MLENQNQNSESMLNSSLFDNLVGSLFDAVPEGVLIVDKSAKIVYINERMRELWNFPKEMSNDTARQIARKLVLNPEEFNQKIVEINQSDQIIWDEHLQLKDGRMYSRSTKPLMINGKKEGRLWTYQDISNQFHSHKLLENLIDRAPIGIALANEKGVFVKINQAWADTIGFDQSDLVNTTFKDHTHPDDVAHCKEIMGKISSGELENISFEKRYIHKDGSTVNSLIHVASLPKHGDQDIRYIVQVVDLTQLKNAEQALFQSHKLESIGVLAGGIAHDFNNLLVAMTTQADVALRKNLMGQNPQTNIEKIKLAAKNASYLTEQLLAYSGRRKFKVEEIDLNLQVEKNNGIFNLAIPKNISLTQKLEARLPKISAEKGQIQQILLNLVINAAESIEGKGGKIDVSTKQVSFSADEIISAKDYILAPVVIGPHVLVSVSDTGVGMDEETIERIFDPFFTTKFTGRGLGLAAVLGIIRGHKGAIRVISQPDEGTTFELYFPSIAGDPDQLDENIPSLEHSDPAFVNSRNELGVLLIDDDENVREALIDLFECENIRLICAADGAEGVEKLAANKEKIGLTLLDLSMPGLSSPETFEELKKVNPELPVMLCSGYSEADISESFSGEEIEGFLPKPFDADQLINLVNAYTQLDRK